MLSRKNKYLSNGGSSGFGLIKIASSICIKNAVYPMTDPVKASENIEANPYHALLLPTQDSIEIEKILTQETASLSRLQARKLAKLCDIIITPVE